MKTKLTGILLLLSFFSGCVKETLDTCPEGNVRVNVYAEKFQTGSSAATQDIEEKINQRIYFMHCILYKEDTYVMDTVIEDLSGNNEPYYPVNFSQLPFGDYNLIIVGNCSPEAMSGDFNQWGGLNLLYPGADQTDDLFATLLPFTVDCNCTMQFDTKLRRLLGVVRCEVTAIPEGIDEFEIIFHNVNSQLGKEGIYSNTIQVNKRMPVVRTRSTAPQTALLGLFPTITDQPASYELKLYSNKQSEAVFSQVISDNVPVLRNQLTELLTDFSNGQLEFTVRLDTKWDDSIQGGEVEIH